MIRGSLLLIALIAVPLPALAQLRAELVAEGFMRPVAIVADPLSPNTFVVVEQPGVARVVVNGVIQPTPFLDLTSEVKYFNEQGFVGLTFSPDGSRVFVHFTKRRDPDLGVGDTVIARFRRSADPLVLDPASRFDLRWPSGQLPFIPQPTDVHKGGNLAFGPDGYLYIGLGDGGAFGDHPNSSQGAFSLLGKMLRIDVNVPDSHPTGYVIPPTNPFIDNVPIPALHEIWSFGWRNPWRYSFDDFGPGATGALIVGDVGLESREEIDYEPAGRGGRNYGWYIREGTIHTPVVSPDRQPAYLPLTEPLVDYPRTVGRTVTGGFVYRGSALPSYYRGRYFVADFFGGVYSVGLSIDPSGEARVADVLIHTAELGDPRLIATFGRGLDGELYFSTFVGGRVFKIVPDTPPLPAAPEPFVTTVDGTTVTLGWQAGAGGGPVLSYQLEAGSAPGLADLLVTEVRGEGLVVPGVPAGLYFVRVRGLNSSGLGPASAEAAVRVGCGGPPLVPSGLTASVASGGIVSLQWQGTGDAIGYLIEAGTEPGLSNVAQIPIGPITAISGPVPSGTYYVRMRALTTCGTTPPSNEAIVVVP